MDAYKYMHRNVFQQISTYIKSAWVTSREFIFHRPLLPTLRNFFPWSRTFIYTHIYVRIHARIHTHYKNSPGPFCDQASFRCPTHLRRSRIFAAQRAFITSRLTTRRSSTFVWSRRTFETYDRPASLSAPLRFSSSGCS